MLLTRCCAVMEPLSGETGMDRHTRESNAHKAHVSRV